jgi:small multidrug resistance pump
VPALPAWVLLGLAILAEVGATTALARAEGFTRLQPSLLAVGGYGLAFYCLSLVLRSIPLGIAYALWCGIGIVLVALAGTVFLHQRLDLPALAGIALIGGGVLVICLHSRAFTP